MGQYYNFELELCEYKDGVIASPYYGEDYDEIRDAIEEEGFETVDLGCFRKIETKGTDHEGTFLGLSEGFENYVFILRGYGEGKNDIWVKYFYKGKMQKEDAEIQFPRFSENKLFPSYDIEPGSWIRATFRKGNFEQTTITGIWGTDEWVYADTAFFLKVIRKDALENIRVINKKNVEIKKSKEDKIGSIYIAKIYGLNNVVKKTVGYWTGEGISWYDDNKTDIPAFKIIEMWLISIRS